MKKIRSTKRALLMSALSLMMCMTMFVGSTFAWFTDSVTSSGNIVKSGSLDVTMEWKDATATGSQQTYKDASEGAIFNNDKWEPGYVEAKNIKISNAGTLALQYNLHIAADGEVSELAEVIDVYFAEGEYTLTSREMTELKLVGTLKDILDGMPANMTGDLEAKTADTVTIALKMQEDAGNEYQDKEIGSAFSVILMATQDNVEEDSFDENYDDIEIPEMDLQTIDGVTYGLATDGNYYMISVDDYTLTSFEVDDKVTVLGTGDGVNDNDRVFGKNAPLTSLELNEGLVEIKDNALNTLPNLTDVELPSTLKTIGIQAFRITGMSSVKIPESVETVKQGAFRDMANLTTVTVEGNVAFDKYAFRSCPNLTSIYLLGDDVTFSGNQFATHDDNGACTSDAHKDNCPGLITIYVKNATVAARVIAAQGTSSCYEVKILGEAADGSDAAEVELVKNVADYDAAIDSGAKNIVLGSGTFVLDKGQNTELTIVGNGNSVIELENNELPSGSGDFCFQNSNVVLENVIVKTSNKDWDGFQNAKDLTLNNCTVNGNLFLTGNATFNNCVFNIEPTANRYNVWAYSSNYGHYTAKFTDCTFNCSGKAIYVDGNSNNGINVIFEGCTFNDNGDDTVVGDKAAIETGTTYGKTYDISITDCKFNGFTINPTGTSTGTVIWGNKHSMTSDKLNVTIDGMDVF